MNTDTSMEASTQVSTETGTDTPGAAAQRQHPRAAAVMAGGAAAYLVLAWVSIELSRMQGSLATIWFANAAAAIAMQWLPARRWPLMLALVALANAGANLLGGNALDVSAAFVPGNVLEAGLLALAMARLRHLRAITPDPVLRFGALLLTLVLPATVGGLIGSVLLALEGIGPLQKVWLTWSLGGVLGALACVPIGLLVHERGLAALRTLAQTRSLVAIVLMTAVVFASFHLFVFPFALAGASVLLVAVVARSAGLAAVLPFLVVTLAGLGLGRDDMAISTLNLLPGHTAGFLASCAITLLLPLLVADTLDALDRVADEVRRREQAVQMRAAEAEDLRHSLEMAQAVARVGSWRIDAASNTITWSRETYRLFGVPNGSPVDSTSLLKLVHPDDAAELDAQWQRALQGAPYDFIYRIVVHGEVRWVRERAKLSFDAKGQFAGAVGTVADVTDQQQLQAERAARQAAEQASEAKGEFLAVMSHEVRTPINGILGLAQLARAPQASGAERQQYLHALEDASRSLSQVVSDVLDLSKIEAGRLELHPAPFELAAWVDSLRQAHEPLARARGLRLHCAIDAALPAVVLGDAVRLRQIAANYLGNALKFTEQGEVWLHLRAAGTGRLRLQVRDTGPGIAPQDRALLFRSFSQVAQASNRKTGGTGLGLAICSDLAALMDGQVGVDSTPGLGSTFWAEVQMPAHLPGAEHDARHGEASRVRAPATDRALDNPDAALPLQGLRLLLADDNELNLFVAQRLLARAGAQVHAVADGQQAVDAVEQAEREG